MTLRIDIINILKRGPHRPSEIRNELQKIQQYKRYSSRSLDVEILREFSKLAKERITQKDDKKHQQVYYSLTKEGKKRVDVEDLLVQIETQVKNVFKEIFEGAIKTKEVKPLISAVAFFISGDFCAIAHFPSESQYEKLKPLIDSKEKQLEVGKLINRVIEFYVTEKEREVYADYVPLKESVFAMSFLSKEQSDTMKEAIEKGLFSRHPQIMAQLNFVTERIWLRFWKALQDPKVLSGEKALYLAKGFRYNPSKKMLEDESHDQVIKHLRKALEEQPPEAVS